MKKTYRYNRLGTKHGRPTSAVRKEHDEALSEASAIEACKKARQRANEFGPAKVTERCAAAPDETTRKWIIDSGASIDIVGKHTLVEEE